MAVRSLEGKLASLFLCTAGCILLLAAPMSSEVLINELNSNSLGDNSLDFIELSDGGRGNTTLDNLVLVLYGGTTDTSYAVWDLSSYRTGQQGLFVLGSSSVVPAPDLFLGSAEHVVETGISAAVLYRRDGRNFTEGMPVQTENIEDVLVYGFEAGHDRELIDSLTPGQLAAHEDPGHSIGDESLSRCCNYKPSSMSAFTLTTPTPGAPNQCGFPCVVINEINVDQPGTSRDRAEFVELYDTEIGNRSLDGLTLVFYNGGKDTSYKTIDLHGYRTNNDGYFVIGSQNIPNADIVLGNKNLIQNGPDAVALYHSPSSEIPQGSYVTRDNLVDAVVYGTDDDVDTELLRILLPGQPQLNESPRVGDGDLSLSRCSCCARRDVSSFGLAVPTPGAPNQNCTFRDEVFVDSTTAHQQEVRISELSTGRAGQEWVELFDGGHGNLLLDNMVLVLYSGHDSRSYNSIELTGNRTDRNGYLLIGSPAVTPPPHIVIDSPVWFLNTSGGVALYHGKRLEDFPVFSNVTTVGLVDAVVYGTRNIDVLTTLTPEQPAIITNTGSSAIVTITRCFSHHHFSLVSFTTDTVPTPAAPNNCPLPPLAISELKLLPEITEYIELSSQGRPYFPLESIVVVFFNADGLSYKSIGIDKVRTNEKGFYLIGSDGMTPQPDFKVQPPAAGFIKNGPNAVALYQGRRTSFLRGTLVTNASLINAVVYSPDQNTSLYNLTSVLTPGGNHVAVTLTQHNNTSISQCSGQLGMEYVSAPITPKAVNYCSFPDNQTLIINEVGTGSLGFIELWDGGAGLTPLDGTTVVLYGGDGTAYMSFSLLGYTTDNLGYFVIGTPALNPAPQLVVSEAADQVDSSGTSGFLPRGPGAVALYGHVGTFSLGMAPSNTSLHDAVVYGTQDQPAQGLLDVLTPGQHQVDMPLPAGDFSIARCESTCCRWLNLTAFRLAPPTPNMENNCTSPLTPPTSPAATTATMTRPYILINEFNIDTPGSEFVELRSPEGGDVSLDGFVLVFYEDRFNPPRAYLTVDLAGNRTSVDGFLVIGSSLVRPTPDVTIQFVPANMTGSYAVGLYYAAASQFPSGTAATRRGMVDAVVYRKTFSPDIPDHLLAILLGEGQQLITDGSEQWSVSRCLSNSTADMSAFVRTLPSPGVPNNCSLPSVVINEFSTDQAGLSAFIELYATGSGQGHPIPLDGLYLALFTGGSRPHAYYKNILVNHETSHGGFFVMGHNASMSQLTLHVQVQPGPGAVCLYQGDHRTLNTGDPPTRNNLVDALVYGSSDTPNQGLIDALIPAQHPVYVNNSFLQQEESISRCTCCPPLQSTSFGMGHLTPNAPNRCRHATVSPPASGTSGMTTPSPSSQTDSVSPNTTVHASTPGTTINSTGSIAGTTPSSTSTISTFNPSTINTTVSQMSTIASTTLNSTTTIHPTTMSAVHTTPSTAAATTTTSTISWPTLPPDAPKIIINELNADSPRGDVQEFLELYDLGLGDTSLDGYCLVFYNGQSGMSYETVDLTGHRTSPLGYFTIGNSRVSPRPNIIISFNFIQNGPDAIGLYFAPAGNFPTGSAPTTQGLVDVVVYGSGDEDARNLLDILAPGQTKIREDSGNLDRDESISRCLSNNTVDLYAFVLDTPTPGSKNNCTLPNIVINEINADQQGLDRAEFIELFTPGRSYASLDGIILVLYNGDSGGTSYNTIDLHNERTDENGYFVIGGPDVPNRDITIIQHVGFLQNGPDAMALYRGYASHFPYRTPVTADNLIDAVVYGRTDEPGDHLVEVLLPGQHLVQEDQGFQDGDESISRCQCCSPLSSASFRLTVPTPGQPNDCISPVPSDLPTLVINEVNVDMKNKDDAEFIELRGDANANVSGLLLVFFSGTDGRSYLTLELHGTTDADGYFLIGHPNRTPPPDVPLPVREGGVIQELANGIGLYYGSKAYFPMRTNVTNRNLLDAVVYTTNRGATSQRLLDVLTPGQDILVEEYSQLDNDDSLSRCQCCSRTQDNGVYVLSPSSAGKANICPSKQHSTTIQVKLVNANCTVFKRNLALFEELKRVVASGVETRCQCGFTIAYLADAEILCGSTILNATLQAISADQLDSFKLGYETFIDKTPDLIVGGQTYSVEPCTYNCLPMTRRKPQGLSPGVKAAIGICCCLAAVVLLLGVVYVWKRTRRGKPDPEWRESWSLSNPAELAPAYSIASFDNPLYDDSSVKNSGFL